MKDSGVADYPTEPREPWIDENGFLCVRTGNERRTKAIVERNFRTAAVLTEGKRRPWMVDARALTGADPVAWVAITERIGGSATSLAILVSNATTAEMANWQSRFDSLLLPCRMFIDEESAVAWLKASNRD